MDRILKHAESELTRANLYDKKADPFDGETALSVMELVQVFVSQKHDRARGNYVLSIFNKLVRLQAITPITDKPDEWADVSEMTEKPLWQNKRDCSVFSEDGGRTWWKVGDKKKEN